MSKKQKGTIMLILTLVTLIGVLVALHFLPDIIPFHFGPNGVGSYTSKYFMLAFVPLPAFLFWALCRKLG